MKNLMNGRALLSGLVVIALGAGAALAMQDSKPKQEHKQDQKQKQEHKEYQRPQDKSKGDDNSSDKSKGKGNMSGVSVGQMAPAFKLTDLNGKEMTLAAAHDGGKNIVVLEWFNPDCPFVKKHHQKATTFKDMYTKYKDKNVVFLAINSGAKGKQGAGLERNKEARSEYGIDYPILLDESGEVGRAYGAKTTPHMFVIGKDGKIAYMGAIDDDSSDKLGKTNYVAKALDELIAGTNVSTSETKPYGCSVKY